MSTHEAHTPSVSLRIRLALAALVVPLGIGAAACKGGLTDSPTTTVPPTEVIIIEGRPLRRRNGRLRRARSRRTYCRITDRHALALGTRERSALAAYWRNQGELEHASVVAFDDLAHRLARVGAPAELVQRSLHAADQEATHARLCFDLSGRYLGEDVRPGRLRRPRRMRRSRTNELTQLAIEALRDGVLNEGYAAWIAARKAERATDTRVRETLHVIARDEAQHASLSADVLAWCVAEGGNAIADAITAATLELPTRMLESPIAEDANASKLADHGVLNADEAGAGYAQVLRETVSVVYECCGELLTR